MMRPPRTSRRLIRSWGGVGGRVVGPGWAELAAAMGSPSVVVPLVLSQDQLQMPLAEDQHPVGDLGPGGEHEPFRISVRARAAGRIFTPSIPAPASTASNVSVNCPARSRTRDRKPAARSPRSISRLRICCTVQGPSGFAVTPRMCTQRLPISMTNRQYRGAATLRSPRGRSRWRALSRPACAGTAATWCRCAAWAPGGSSGL